MAVVLEYLERLKTDGAIGERLGPELLDAGSRVLEHDRAGESDAAFADCFDVLFQALDTASLSPADQLEWAIEAAASYLRKIKNALTRAGRKQEWDEYLASLREENNRRPRCLEMLDRLQGKRRRIINT